MVLDQRDQVGRAATALELARAKPWMVRVQVERPEGSPRLCEAGQEVGSQAGQHHDESAPEERHAVRRERLAAVVQQGGSDHQIIPTRLLHIARDEHTMGLIEPGHPVEQLPLGSRQSGIDPAPVLGR